MATRRTLLRAAGAIPAAALLAACRPAPAAAPPAGIAPADLLVVETSGGLALLDARSGRNAIAPRDGVAAWDGSALSSATRVDILPAAGYDLTVPGSLSPRVVAPGGARVALASGTAAGSVPYRPAGRTSTTIAIADQSGVRRTLTLPGCVEPEAFSTQGDLLYVLDYLPPANPSRYRVRMVDLGTGQYLPLLTRDKKVIPPGAEEEMRGEGRQAAYSSARQMLFTLYTHQPDHSHTRDLLAGGARAGKPDVHAFVHSLALDGQFAYCIDLPAPFGEAPAPTHAIAVGNTGDPYVIDATSGTIAHINGAELTVARKATFPGSKTTAAAVATVALDTLFIASGPNVYTVDTGSLVVRAQHTMPSPVRGLVPSPDRQHLWVGQESAAVAVDIATGRAVATVPVPNLTTIAHALRA